MPSFAVPTLNRAVHVLVAIAVAVAVLLPAFSAYAADTGDVAVLAAPAEDIGPVPADRLAEENSARELVGYDDRDVPFTWGAAWLLVFTGFMGLATAALLYRMKVVRPQRQK